MPNADSAGPIVSLVFFILVALSGLYFPVKAGTGLATFTGIFPIRHLIVASVDTFNGDPGHVAVERHPGDRRLGRGGRLGQPAALGLVAQAGLMPRTSRRPSWRGVQVLGAAPAVPGRAPNGRGGRPLG